MTIKKSLSRLSTILPGIPSKWFVKILKARLLNSLFFSLLLFDQFVFWLVYNPICCFVFHDPFSDWEDPLIYFNSISCKLSFGNIIKTNLLVHNNFSVVYEDFQW